MHLTTYINRLKVLQQFTEDIKAIKVTTNGKTVTIVCEPWYSNRLSYDIAQDTKRKANKLKAILNKYFTIDHSCNCIYVTLEGDCDQ